MRDVVLTYEGSDGFVGLEGEVVEARPEPCGVEDEKD